MAPFIERNLGRPLKVLGVHSQVIRNNWKLYAENLRDSYHATLLHTFYTSFKVNRLDMDGGITLADKGWHHISFARRAKLQEDAEYAKANVHSAKADSNLAGPRAASGLGRVRRWYHAQHPDDFPDVVHPVHAELARHPLLRAARH
jgi:anthranilate 1,2-dioxygenase large subunit